MLFLHCAVIVLISVLCCWFHLENKKKKTDDLTGFIYLCSLLAITLTVAVYVGELVKLVFGEFNPATVLTLLMTLLLCGWIFVGTRKHSPKPHEGLIYVSAVAVIVAFCALGSLYLSNAEKVETIADSGPTWSETETMAKKEIEKQHDLAVRQHEKETVELLHRMAMLNASTQVQVANISLQSTTVENEAKVQIAKTIADKELHIAELETKVKLAENDVKLKSEQVKVLTAEESLRRQVEQLKIELAKVEKDATLELAKTNVEKEIRLAQENAKIRLAEEATKQLEEEAKLKRLELTVKAQQMELLLREEELTKAEQARIQQEYVMVTLVCVGTIVAVVIIQHLLHRAVLIRNRSKTSVQADSTMDEVAEDLQRKTLKFANPRHSENIVRQKEQKAFCETSQFSGELETEPS